MKGRQGEIFDQLEHEPGAGPRGELCDHTDLVEVQKRLDEACDRLYDMLLGGDGQAFSEAERFLKRHRPDLYNRIGMEGQADLFMEH